MSLKLHTENVPGNLHQAAMTINSWGWAEYVLAMEMVGNYTVTVFKMPAAKVHEIRSSNQGYTLDPHHDDYTGPDDPYASDFRLSQVLNAVEHKVQETHPPQEAKQDAVSSSSDKPTEEAKPTRKKPQPKPDQVKQAAATESNSEAAGEGAQVTHAETGAASAAGAAERAQNSNLPDWAK